MVVVTAPVAVAVAPKSPDPRCSHIGELVCRDLACALRLSDGSYVWLEMDRIPMHLIDTMVRVDGILFGDNLISVEAIGPAIH